MPIRKAKYKQIALLLETVQHGNPLEVVQIIRDMREYENLYEIILNDESYFNSGEYKEISTIRLYFYYKG
jgi:hypothetical protein